MNNNYKLPLEHDDGEKIKKRLKEALQSLLDHVVYDPLKSAGRTPQSVLHICVRRPISPYRIQVFQVLITEPFLLVCHFLFSRHVIPPFV